MRGERRAAIAAADFFKGIFQTALAANELLVAVELPVVQNSSQHYFHEFARRRGDYAIAGLAAQALLDGSVFAELRMGFFGVGDRAVLARAANKLVNAPVTPALLLSACEGLGAELDFQEDQQASAAMRRHLARVLFARCVAALLQRPELHINGGVV